MAPILFKTDSQQKSVLLNMNCSHEAQALITNFKISPRALFQGGALTLTIITMCLVSDATCAQESAQILTPALWFGPMQDHFDSDVKKVSWDYYDFLNVLATDAPWKKSQHRIDAIMLSVVHASEGFSHEGKPSLPAIKTLLSHLNVNAAGGGSVVYTGDACEGAGVEGMTSDKEFAREVYYSTKAWHDAGMPMSYFVMDGPYGFGVMAMKDKCHFSPEDVAHRAVTTMKMIRSLYPKVIIIDAEGPGPGVVADWLPGYHRFLAAFHKEFGTPIDYLDMDLAWVDKWHTGYRWTTAAKQIAGDMHKLGMKVSLIVDAEDQSWDPDVAPPSANANPRTDMTNDYWMKAVRKHIDLIKTNNIPLDAVDLESWMKFPRKNLPETDPRAWTSVINYARDVLMPNR